MDEDEVRRGVLERVMEKGWPMANGGWTLDKIRANFSRGCESYRPSTPGDPRNVDLLAVVLFIGCRHHDDSNRLFACADVLKGLRFLT